MKIYETQVPKVPKAPKALRFAAFAALAALPKSSASESLWAENLDDLHHCTFTPLYINETQRNIAEHSKTQRNAVPLAPLV